MKVLEPTSKRVIFNFPINLAEELGHIPRGKRSEFVSHAVERAFAIQRRIRAVERFDRLNKGIIIKRTKGGWGPIRKFTIKAPLLKP